jgi:hypothetical protein
VLGYLVGGDKNEKRPNVVVRENAVEIRTAQERVVMSEMTQIGAMESLDLKCFVFSAINTLFIKDY